MQNRGREVCEWTKASIDRECRESYRHYERALVRHYLEYYARHPAERCEHHAYSAQSVAAALPPGCAPLARLIPARRFHRHARSARSSQVLSLALLGASHELDPSLAAFWSSADIALEVRRTRETAVCFEHAIAPSALGEKPRVTELDVLISTEDFVAAVETKWSEVGFGICSCARESEGNPAAGHACAARVNERRRYWATAAGRFALDAQRLPLLPCPMSVFYQAVRCVAAIDHIAGPHRKRAFVLLHDERNPYFRQTGSWPGWPSVLAATLNRKPDDRFTFRAIAWQQLVEILPLPPAVRAWARQKHQLGA